MKLRLFGQLLLIYCLATTFASFAGTTGKISGAVYDAGTGEPMPGVNVVLQGTLLGAATDAQGRFIIMNIPPGQYTLSITMIGYTTQRISQVGVNIDMTTPIQVKLTQTVLEAGEEVTIVAERPLVRMDMTSSLSSVGAEEISALPVQEVQDVLELQAGIVRDGSDLHIRGGRAGEIAYWIDGVATTDVFSGRMGLQVENNSIKELQVISGTFNAEYGQAMSGIINIVTKEGQADYSGMLKAWIGDYVSHDETFAVAERVYRGADAETGETLGVGEYENPLKKFNANYNLEGSLSGPVPFTSGKLNFFVNGRMVSDEGYLYGRRWFLPYGLPGDSALVPMNAYSRSSLQAKLTYHLGKNIKISYNGFVNQYTADRQFQQSFKYNPDGTPQQHGHSNTQILSLNHVLSPTTFYDLKLNRFYNDYEQYVYEDPNV
ncbi:MAG: TonB-dependent receptor, partial [Calditrichaeota bacterium]